MNGVTETETVDVVDAPLPSVDHLVAEPEDNAELNEDVEPLAIEITMASPAVEFNREKQLSFVASIVATDDYPIGRPPLDLAILVNRSESAASLEAIKAGVEYLVAQCRYDDRVAIVSYDEEVHVDFDFTSLSPTAKGACLGALEAIPTGSGASNLEAALKRGISIMTNARDRLAVAAVLVLTDADPTVGATEPEALLDAVGMGAGEQKRSLRMSARAPTDREQPWIVYTVGYGRNHSAALLQGLSTAGKGVYYFVDKDDLVANALADCVGGFGSAVAIGMELWIRPTLGAEVVEIEGDYRDTEYDNGFVLGIGDIHRGERKDILVTVLVEPLDRATPTHQPQHVVDVNLRYFDLRYSDSVGATAHLYEGVLVHRPNLVEPKPEPAMVQLTRQRLQFVKLLKACVPKLRKARLRAEVATEMEAFSQDVAASDVSSHVVALGIMSDVAHLCHLFRDGPHKDLRYKYVATAQSQHALQRSACSTVNTAYQTKDRASMVLRVGVGLQEAMDNLLAKKQWSDVELHGVKAHRPILMARCPLLLESEFTSEEADALLVVMWFVYTGEYVLGQRPGTGVSTTDTKYAVLALAERLQLPRLAALVRADLVHNVLTDIRVVALALENGEHAILDWFVWRFVRDAGNNAASLSATVGSVCPALLPRIFSEFRQQAMVKPDPIPIPASSLEADLAALLESGDASDYDLTVVHGAERTTLRLHRCVLFARARFFQNVDNSKPMQLPLPVKSFRALLRFLYTNRAPSQLEDCLNIVAHYSTSGINSVKVAKQAISLIEPHTCFDAYAQASKLRLKAFADAALDVMEDSFGTNVNTAREYVEHQQGQILQLHDTVAELSKRLARVESAIAAAYAKGKQDAATAGESAKAAAAEDSTA